LLFSTSLPDSLPSAREFHLRHLSRPSQDQLHETPRRPHPPWLTFFTIGRPFDGIFCLILQLTIVGWLPAPIWAVYALSLFKTDQKIRKALAERD